MGMTALGVLVAMAGSAGAVSDRNTSERGQMIPSPDTPAAMGHVNNMMQERMAAAGGPTDRTVTAFGEEIVKTLPLIPGASVITYPVITPSGNLFAGHGRGIGFSSITVHEPVTGRIIWQTPRYLGPQDYLLQRTVGPGAYLGGYPGIVDDGTLATNNYATTSDAHNIWAFDADSGEVKWVTSQSDWAPGPQRVREEPLRPQSMANDTTIATPLLPKALKAPSGEPLAGSLFTRGNFAYVDMLNGDLVILQNGDADNLAVGYQAPILYLIIDLLCFPGGQVSLEFKDFCSAFVYTRYFSVNTVMADPIRNRVTVTYAGDGATFDRFMTWEFITDGGPGQPGTILPDADLTDGDSPAMQLSWSTNFGLNSGATPTWSDSGTVIFGVDGAGITNAFDANDGAILASSTGGGAGFSPSTDHNDLLVICSPEAGLAQVSPIDGSFIFQNTADGLGLEHLPVMPDSPLLVTGRPGEQCVGFPVTHPDMYQAQFVLGYPIRLLEALAALGIPIPSTVTSTAIADFQADAQTGETIPAKFRSVYNGSGEASLGAMDSGRYISGRVDAVAAINAGILNLLLPRRFDVPPAEGGFLISEPRSWRESVLAQFQGAAQYCDEVINGRFGPDGGVITEPLPVVVAAPDAFNKARWLQLNVNKVGYINSIMKNSVPGRLGNATAALEISDLEAAVVIGNAADIVVAITVARDGILLANQPADPSRAQQNQALVLIQSACDIVDETITVLDRDVCTVDAQCDDGNPCTVNTCNLVGICELTTKPDGAVCGPDLTCIAGVCGTDEERRIMYLKDEIVRIAEANTTRTDNIDEVRAELDPLVDELEQYFIADRPENEVELLQGSWKSLWYDDPDIDQADAFLGIDRSNVYQVIFSDFYYNVADTELSILGFDPTLVHSFLKGNFTLTNLPDETNVGEPRLNVIDLEFDDNVARLGSIPRDKNLVDLVLEVDSGQLPTLPVPGPKGITGELWNAYLDDELRISRGQQDDNGVLDMYILRRVVTASD